MSASQSPDHPYEGRPSNFNPTIWWLSIAGICTIIILGSVFITLSYRRLSQEQAENPRPLYIGKLETDLEVTNRDDSTVFFHELKDKIYVVGYQYTDCPSGCLGMAGVMEELHEKFGDREEFHLVSVSLQPEVDTPEKMDQWVKQNGVDVNNWWFVTGDPEEIRKYMKDYFMFFQATENTDPAVIASQGKWAHDQRLALVDGKANVRGYYGVMNTEDGDKEVGRLISDIEYLFEERAR